VLDVFAFRALLNPPVLIFGPLMDPHELNSNKVCIKNWMVSARIIINNIKTDP